MQLVSSDSHNEDISESEPILSQSESLQRSEESSSASSSSLSSSEITAVSGDCVVVADLHNLYVDETSHLVNADQPQCRICFDIGGLYSLFFLVSFLFLMFISEH